MKTVVICFKDDGRVKVGEIPEGEAYQNTGDADYPYMQEVANPGEALELAEGMLTGNTAESEARADAEMAHGFNEAMPRREESPPPKGPRSLY